MNTRQGVSRTKLATTAHRSAGDPSCINFTAVGGRVKWIEPTEAIFPLADNVFVRRQDDVFRIYFGRADLPMKVPLYESDLSSLASDGIPARLVATVAIPVNLTCPQNMYHSLC